MRPHSAPWALLLAPALALAACTPAALAGFFGAAAPVVGDALGAYAAAARDAQRQAGLRADDPLVVALNSTLAALHAAEDKLDAAKRPVECIEPVPVGEPLPPPAVNVDALATALQDVAASNRAVVEALGKVKAKKPKKAKPEPLPSSVLPMADAGAEGGA